MVIRTRLLLLQKQLNIQLMSKKIVQTNVVEYLLLSNLFRICFVLMFPFQKPRITQNKIHS